MGTQRSTPSYDEAIAYYLRDDVSEVLWMLSQRRLLHFYYYCDRSIQDPDAVTHRKAFHCVPDVEAFRELVAATAASASASGTPFFPFFRMEPDVNVPAEADRPLGWDFCLEIDLDQKASFDGLIPTLAVLEHFGVSVLGKFSGHRSLHVIVPAEAFPEPMRRSPDKKEWMASFDRLGRFLSRIVPAVNRTAWGLAKHQPITTPYSLHRYHGGISLPLTLGQAVHFDSATADIQQFAGTTWSPDALDSDGVALNRLFARALETEATPSLAIDLAEEVFRGADWGEHLARAETAKSGNPLSAALDRGPVGINFLPESSSDRPDRSQRIRAAIQRIEDPELKAVRYLRLFGHVGYAFDWRTGRRDTCDLLAIWCDGGMNNALKHLLTHTMESGRNEFRVARAVRLFSMIPESPEVKLSVLKETQDECRSPSLRVRLFLTLAAAELVPTAPEALLLLHDGDGAADTDARDLLAQQAPWRVETDPIVGVAALHLTMGRAEIQSWLREPDQGSGHQVVLEVFGGDRKKFEHAARMFQNKGIRTRQIQRTR